MPVGVRDVSSRPVKEPAGRNEADLVAVLQRELDDRAYLIVVDRVHDRHDEADIVRGMKRLIARSFTSNRLPTFRCALASSVTPSNCR